MKNIATVVIDEVQMLEDNDRGHRLDGMIARLKYLAPQAQFLYLSATIGSPKVLAKNLAALSSSMRTGPSGSSATSSLSSASRRSRPSSR